MPIWSELQRDLFRAVLDANATVARAQFSCPVQDFVLRTRHSHRLLSSIFNGTITEHVRSVIVPAAGSDAMTALRAFPRADRVTLISKEPILPASARHSFLEWPHLPATALAALHATFACSHRGGYFLGIQLRAFADAWGILPVLLIALSIGHVSITNVTFEPLAMLPQVTLHGHVAGSSRRHLVIRYVQASLSGIPSVTRVLNALRHPWPELDRRWVGSNGGSRGSGRAATPLQGLLIKSAEVAFRGGEATSRPAQDALSRGLLAQADVLLQDTQSSVRWPLLHPWLHPYRPALGAGIGARGAHLRGSGALALGAYIGADEALEALTVPSSRPPSLDSRGGAARASELRAEDASLRRLFGEPRTQRSLRRLRFGYCHSALFVDPGLLARRLPPSEPPALGEEDVNERRGDLYCSALLAWRQRPTSRTSSYFPSWHL